MTQGTQKTDDRTDSRNADSRNGDSRNKPVTTGWMGRRGLLQSYGYRLIYRRSCPRLNRGKESSHIRIANKLKKQCISSTLFAKPGIVISEDTYNKNLF